MTQAQRTIAFLCAMFMTFGITGLDFENPVFADNKMVYASIGIGLILLIVFVVQKIKN